MTVLLLALLSSLVREFSPREEARGLLFTRPKGWTKSDDPNTKLTSFKPPGLGGGQECTLVLYPTSKGFTGTDQDLHDAIFKSVTQGSALHGEAVTGKTGLFQSSRATMTAPGGPKVWIAVHTAKAGDTIGGAAFLATSEALFKTHGASVDEMVQGMRFAGVEAPAAARASGAPASAAGGQTIHGLILPLPEGWTRKEEPWGGIALFPPPPKSVLEPRWDYVLYVLASAPLQGTHWQTHKAIFESALKSSQLKDPVPPIHEAAAPGPFIKSSSAGHDASGSVRNVSMYSALSDGKIECILVHNQEDQDGVAKILARTTVKNPPKKVERPKIVEAYRRMNAQQFVTRDGELLRGSWKYERIWLRSDGVADFSTTYLEGYAAAAVVFKHDPGLENGRVGSWKPRGDTQVQIVRTAGAKAEVYERDNGRLRFGDQLWQPMPPVDGMRLDGRWAIKPTPGVAVQPPKIWIEFTKEGRFTDDGILDHACPYDLTRGKPPKKGAGTYELPDWTIFLKYDDGTRWTTDFSTIGTDPQDHSSILFSTYVFQKE